MSQAPAGGHTWTATPSMAVGPMPQRHLTATPTPRRSDVPTRRSAVGPDQRATGRGVDGAVATSTVTVSAVASVFTPSAASRPSRLAAVAQTSECYVEFDGEPDRIAFPLQAAVEGSAWVGSVVVNAALLTLAMIAVFVASLIGA